MTRRRTIRDDRGQALVEFALILPVLLMLLLGIVEFGRAWNTKQVVTDAAREGARRAIVNNPTITADSVRAVIAQALVRANIPPAAATITMDEANMGNSGVAQTVFVSVPYRFAFFGPLFELLTGSETIPIATAVTMRNE